MPVAITYHWFHVPTKTSGTNTVEAWRPEFMERLNRWNAQQPGVWHYWV